MRHTQTRLRIEPLERRAVPAVLLVGPTRPFTKPSQAAAVAQDGDTVRIDAGTYTNDAAVWQANDLTIEGVGGRAVLDATGFAIPNRKAIFTIVGANATVRNLTFQGAHDAAGADKNWAGIRQEGATLTVLDCAFLRNDDGILANAVATSDITVRRTEFGFNGYGDGQSHNIYVNQVRSFTLTDSYTHDANVGHLVKSRALTNVLRYNRIVGGTGTGSYEVNLPNGGDSYLVGNVIQQGAASQNGTVVSYAEEGATNPVQRLYVVGNTVVNDRSAGTFVRVAGTPADAWLVNNVFAGPGTVLSGPATQNHHNLTTTTAIFVNPAGYDYRLRAGTAAIDAGVAPGAVNGVDLTPLFQPTAPLVSEPRPAVGPLDIGAFEYRPPQVGDVAVNAGQPNGAQRSRVTSLAVTFDAVVTFAGPVANAFALSRIGGGTVGGFTATASVVNGVTVVTLSGFIGAETEFGSLADGRYSLTVRANQIVGGFDGNGDGTAGDDYTLNGSVANGLYRLYGDANADGVVNATDFGPFRNAFGSATGQTAYLDWLDLNGDGAINAFDFSQFRTRFGSGVP